MIKIANEIVDLSLLGQYAWSVTERNIAARMARSPKTYVYPTQQSFQFELRLRNQIVLASMALNNSGASFAVFAKSKCNPAYWTLERNGAFRLNPGVTPSLAIRDIYMNGRAYAFECSVAIVIVYYKAVLESIHEAQFNRLFADLYLWSWNYDKDLHLSTIRPIDVLAGDVVYFANPDHDPTHPEWQGENAVDLGDGTYFGHGIGIQTEEGIIAALNGYRKPGATRSAYLKDQATRPDFIYLSRFSSEPDRARRTVYPELPLHPPLFEGELISARVGRSSFVTAWSIDSEI